LPLPRTYKEIEEMVRQKVLTTDMARKIVRKAGFRPGTIEDSSGVRISAIPILDIPGTRSAGPDDCPWTILFNGGFAGRTFAITNTGTMYGWGLDAGRFGIPSGATSYTSPTRMHPPGIPDITDAVQFATNEPYTFCLRANGRVLSNAETSEAFTWAEQPNTDNPYYDGVFTDAVMVAAGSASIQDFPQEYILRANGQVWAKGAWNMPGFHGSGDAYDVPDTLPLTLTGALGAWTPMSMTKLGGPVVSIVHGSEQLIFLREDGVVGSWATQADPVFHTGAPSGIVKMIGAGSTTVLVLTGDGEIWTIGSNNFGQRGLLASSDLTALGAFTQNLNAPRAFAKVIGDGYTDVASATQAVFAVRDGRLWAWGLGGVRSARGASAPNWGAPVEVTDPDIDDVESVWGNWASMGVSANGVLISASQGAYIWGTNTNGSLGQGVLGGSGSGIPIPLADPDCVGSPVPNPPWQATSCSLGTPGSHLSTLTESERQEFWVDAFAAERGEQAGLDDMREWVTQFIGEGSIVRNRIMPMLGYDYAGGVSTITLDADGACRIEVDVAPPSNGWWEQYKTGDSRFSDHPTFGPSGGGFQDFKILVKQIVFRTGGTTTGVTGTYLAGTSNQGHTLFTPCPDGGNPAQYPTHSYDSLRLRNRRTETTGLDTFAGPEATGYVANINQNGTLGGVGQAASVPYISLQSPQILDEPQHKWYPTSSLSPFDRSAMHLLYTNTEGVPITTSTFGKFRAGMGLDIHAVTARWRLCGDAPMTTTDWPLTQEVFPTFYPLDDFRAIPSSERSSTYPTIRDLSGIKEGQEFTKEIDFSLQPTPWVPTNFDDTNGSIVRATWDFELFDVVAVRVRKNG
jgi:hypothetical protein